MKRVNKKGQFYLITAIIISIIVIGFIALNNYSKRQTSTKLYDLGEELGIESSNILDFGTYNQYDETQMAELISSFIANYSDYIEEGNDLYFLFGDQSGVTVIAYSQLVTSINVSVNGIPQEMAIDADGETKEFDVPDGQTQINEVVITIEGIDYRFELNAGENFYFVISQDLGDDQYVITN